MAETGGRALNEWMNGLISTEARMRGKGCVVSDVLRVVLRTHPRSVAPSERSRGRVGLRSLRPGRQILPPFFFVAVAFGATYGIAPRAFANKDF